MNGSCSNDSHGFRSPVHAFALVPAAAPVFTSRARSITSQNHTTRVRSPRRHAVIQSCADVATALSGDELNTSFPANVSSTYICTSLTASTIAGQLSQMTTARKAGADLVEIRVDLLDAAEQPKWMDIFSERAVPAIVTNRAAWEGGKAIAAEHDRLSVLIDAIQAGAEFVDVELKAANEFRALCAGKSVEMGKTRLILSHHNFDRSLSPKEIDQVQTEMQDCAADICKIAMMITNAIENAVVFDTLRAATRPTIMLGMGEMGQVSRIVAGKFGAFLTFASVEAGSESAPGQVDTATLQDLYRFRDINADTPLYGVIGNPVGHSMSPAVHNAAFAEKSLKGAYVALKVESNVPDFVRAMTQRGFKGFSVTIPAKLEVMKGVDTIEEVASKIGAMNTVVQEENGELKGYNTDWVAAISAVEEQVQGGLGGKKVLVIGAGGAGRALAFGALERGATEVTVANRTTSKAETLARDLGTRARGIGLDAVSGSESIEKFDVVMNSSSVGMHPDVEESPVGRGVLGKGVVVFDAVYNPLQTRLLREAKEEGGVCVSGIEMFVRQAAEQFRLWFPAVEPPVKTMRDVVLKTLSK